MSVIHAAPIDLDTYEQRMAMVMTDLGLGAPSRWGRVNFLLMRSNGQLSLLRINYKIHRVARAGSEVIGAAYSNADLATFDAYLKRWTELNPFLQLVDDEPRKTLVLGGES